MTATCCIDGGATEDPDVVGVVLVGVVPLLELRDVPQPASRKNTKTKHKVEAGREKRFVVMLICDAELQASAATGSRNLEGAQIQSSSPESLEIRA